ncbi:3-carboxymuconate cyclase [Stutzerimonas stutzeri]|uniref:3-carboxymuconate cyclase n=1 Tax=Stutzerimonas stutzeri TaxID=316 RepID=W8R2H8_STUST|nr:lactonase family protein [Stutzerimonas stutzeri]AHL73718.1 3-carboxymuconate cyclase [Stutzerimonas stutzeri]MCQ4328767.1 lactonase family protein [Stutzerimonas stutzeri]
MQIRLGIAAALLAFSTAGAAAPMYQVLIGSYTGDDNSKGIYRMQFDAGNGQLESKPLQVVRTDNPSWLALDLNRNRLYAANENGPGQPDPVGRVSAFIMAPNSGQLSPLAQQITLGDEPTHLSQSRDGRYLFVSNYGSNPNPGGSLAVMPTAKDGTLMPVTQIATHKASEVHPERQQSSHVHSAVVSPDGKTLFVSDLGADKIFAYRYDPANAERPLSPADPAFISLPEGSGPRHLVFSPDGLQAYVTLELSAQVARFDHVDGSLVQRQLVDLAAGGDIKLHSPGAIHPSADGRFLYISDRAEKNRIMVYAIEDNANLREIQQRSSEGREPREFAIDPSGRYMIIANQKSDALVVLRRDPDNGMLGDTLQTLPIGRPSDVKFIDRSGL